MAGSRALEVVEQLLEYDLATALRVGRAAWRQLSIEERALVTADWPFWFREKQFPPAADGWRSWGFLTGRGLGKTTACSYYINVEVEDGRAKLIGLCAQDEQSSIDIQINGPNGLIATAPPNFKPVWEASALQLVWPNGARAYVRTPEVPGKIRGLDYHLFWASELQSWPVALREEAWSNVELSTRLGYARILWDSTPKRRHPILKARLADAVAVPSRHFIVRGTTHENAANLGDGYIEELERKYKGTAKGREELLGEMADEAEGALWKQEWLDKHRRSLPARLARRVISIDPAVTDRKGSDTTGIVEVGLGVDGRGYVIADRSGKYKPEQWAEMLLDDYVSHECDLIIAETNKGGQLVASTLKAYAKLRGLEVIVLDKNERAPQRQPGKVFIREVHARGSKEERAIPAATSYERGRVSHVLGSDLESLESTLTTWEPPPPEKARSEDSPGDLDALVHACVELLELNSYEPDLSKGFEGIVDVARQITTPPKAQSQVSSLASVFSSAFSGRQNRI